MPHRSKREVAPPPPPVQFPSGAVPWWPMAPPPGVGPSGVRPPGESMGHPFPPAGWWPGLPPPPMPPGFVGSGPSWGAQPQSQGEASECGVDYSPQGGLLSYLQNGNAPFPAPVSDSSSQHAAPAKKSKKRKSPVIIDDGDDGRKAKRLPYTLLEDELLVSAWLHNSNDPINGNCKKNESYWADVVADYNITTPVHRKREVKHLKDRFQKIKRWVSMFCGSWKKASSIYTSGQSDDMLKEKALQFYLDDYKEGAFTVIHCWRQLRNEPKWHVLLEQSENNKRKLDGEGDMMGSTQGQYTRGDYRKPTMILEAVASHDLRIWHAFFGMAGSNNDINVLNQSPLFLEVLKGEAPTIQFSVNGTEYNTGYYLADGIYPEWAAFVKSISSPQLEKHKLYASHQEGARKDIERAFGVLQARFNIVRRPARLWSAKSLHKIMYACVIIHNMIVEDEGKKAEECIDLNQTAGSSVVLPPEANLGTNTDPSFDDVRHRNAAIRARPIHTQLKKDLIEHIWHRFSHMHNN